MSDICKMCGEAFDEPSTGGPGICPSCDCGIPPEVPPLRRQLAQRDAENERLLRELANSNRTVVMLLDVGHHDILIKAQEAEIERLRVADLIWDDKNPEEPAETVEDIADAVSDRQWFVVQQAHRLEDAIYEAGVDDAGCRTATLVSVHDPSGHAANRIARAHNAALQPQAAKEPDDGKDS